MHLLSLKSFMNFFQAGLRVLRPFENSLDLDDLNPSIMRVDTTYCTGTFTGTCFFLLCTNYVIISVNDVICIDSTQG